MKAYFKKIDGGLYPIDDEGFELMTKIKQGQPVSCEVKRVRNYKFLQKLMCLMKYAYDHFEPEELEYKGVVAMKSFKRFRKDLTILAGYYDATYDINGDLKLEARSISFGKMSPDEFDALYSDMIDVVIKRVLTGYTKDNLENVINDIIGFV